MFGWSRPSPGAVVVPALLVSAGTAALGLSRALPLTAVLLVGVGLTQILFMTGCNTSFQMIVPDALRGRLMGLYVLVFVGVTPFGAFLVGTLAQTLGVGAACLIGGGVGFALVLALALGSGLRPAPPSA